MKTSKFVVVTAGIRFFKLILESGTGNHVPYVKAVSTALKRELDSRYETFGYDTNGKFYLFLHYEDLKDLQKRLDHLDKVCSRVKIDAERKLQLIYGACEVNEKRDVVDAAIKARDALAETEDFIGLRNFTFYENEDSEDKLDHDFIEMNAEKAIQKNDFKVFFQPKYNIEKNTVDGAEALMRWFIPEENRFYPPGAFLPVIETNGFIAKVDIYVFEQVCMYLRRSLDSGERVYPVSVNVSRMTAAQNDFVEKYVEIKNKYRIRNGLLAIEFTESSDLQNYTMMNEILTKLHQNGFLCSLDDFGTGYSSYECLKSLNFDEIKLDRFFIKDGLETERDNAIVKSVIDLGKSLHMKVTSEGVDSDEVYQKLKEYGCEVLQGYLYSKPMPLADYVSFINSAYHGAFH